MQSPVAVVPSQFIKDPSAAYHTTYGATERYKGENLERLVLWHLENLDHVIRHPELNARHCDEKAGDGEKVQHIVRFAKDEFEFAVEVKAFG
jgi:hypothetical protein